MLHHSNKESEFASLCFQFVGAALVVHWHCIGPELVLHWHCIGTALALPWPCIGDVLELFCHFRISQNLAESRRISLAISYIPLENKVAWDFTQRISLKIRKT